jgi:hypothetical protein
MGEALGSLLPAFYLTRRHFLTTVGQFRHQKWGLKNKINNEPKNSLE